MPVKHQGVDHMIHALVYLPDRRCSLPVEQAYKYLAEGVTAG
jgi:hypothetical protein